MSGSVERWLYPESAQAEPASERKKMLRKARLYSLDNWGWLGALVIMLVTMVLFRPLAFLCYDMLGISGGKFLRALAGAVGGGLAFILMSWFLRARVRRSLRQQLFERGVPICVVCGYDLTGNESGVCPECGVEW
jgi:hypothetical protein